MPEQLYVPPKPKTSVKSKATGWVAIAAVVVGGFEGVSTIAYKDPLGIPTICYGETRGVRMGQTATMEECETKLAKGLIEFDAMLMARYGKDYWNTIPDETRAMFVSMAYNVGPGGKGVKDGFFTLKNGNESTISKKVRAGDLHGACLEMPKWDNPKWLRGIAKRRAVEAKRCLNGLAVGGTSSYLPDYLINFESRA